MEKGPLVEGLKRPHRRSPKPGNEVYVRPDAFGALSSQTPAGDRRMKT